jgi:hypothetical protein
MVMPQVILQDDDFNQDGNDTAQVVLQDDDLIKKAVGNDSISRHLVGRLDKDGNDAKNKASWSLTASLNEQHDPKGVGMWQIVATSWRLRCNLSRSCRNKLAMKP